MSPSFLTELLPMQQHSQCAGPWEMVPDINDCFSSLGSCLPLFRNAAAKVLINQKQNKGSIKYLPIVTLIISHSYFIPQSSLNLLFILIKGIIILAAFGIQTRLTCTGKCSTGLFFMCQMHYSDSRTRWLSFGLVSVGVLFCFHFSDWCHLNIKIIFKTLTIPLPKLQLDRRTLTNKSYTSPANSCPEKS